MLAKWSSSFCTIELVNCNCSGPEEIAGVLSDSQHTAFNIVVMFKFLGSVEREGVMKDSNQLLPDITEMRTTRVD